MTGSSTTRERILAAAAALFHEKGFNGTGMAELASQVGMTKSSLYHHFPKKQALLSEIIEVTVNRVTPLIQQVAESDQPVCERFRRAVAIHTAEAIHDQDAVACFIEEGRYLSPDFMAAHVLKRDGYEQIFRQMFEEGIVSGEFLDQDAELAVRAVLGMCNSVVRWYSADGPHTPEEIASLFADMALRAASGVAALPRVLEGVANERSA